MSEHTPGPWEYGEDYSYRDVIKQAAFKGSEEKTVAFARWRGGSDCTLDISEADALLIAASPDLLAVCRMIVDAVEGGDEMAAVEAARAAIAKATGGTP